MDLEEIRNFLRKALDGYGTAEILDIVADIKLEQSQQRKLENKPIEAQITKVISNVVKQAVNDLNDIIETGVIPPQFFN